MTDYKFKNDIARMLRMLRNSKTLKIKNNWSRDTGAGFLKEDIKELKLNQDETINVRFTWSTGFHNYRTNDFNLRETEELIEYLEENEIRDDLVKKEMMLRIIRGNFGRDAA